MAALSGPLSKRRLGTRSGELRRLARQAERDGADGAANQLYFAAAQAKLGEGSAISSAEGNIATADLERRASQGLAQTKMDLLTGRTTAATGGLLAARQKLFEDAKAAGGFSDELKNRGRELGVTDSGLALAQSRLPVRGGSPAANPGTPGSVAGNPAATAYNPAKPDGDGNGIPDLIQRPSLKETKPAPAPVREGRINGMPASNALASMRRPDSTEPGNLADLKARDAADREAAINAAISESAGNAKVTRGSVIDRINKERAAKGLQTYGDDIYKDIAGRDIAKSEAEYKAQSDRVSGRAPAMIGGSRVSQYENLSGDQLRRIAAQGQKPPVDTAAAPPSTPAAAPAPPVDQTLMRPGETPISHRRRLIDMRNSGVSNPSNVTFDNPLAAVRDRYKMEEDKKLKTPLRSAWLAAGSGLAAAGRNLTQTY